MKQDITNLVKKMPPEFSMSQNRSATPPSNYDNVTPQRSNSSIAIRQSLSSGRLKNLADKGKFLWIREIVIFVVQNVAARGQQRFMRNSPSRSNKMDSMDSEKLPDVIENHLDGNGEAEDANFEVFFKKKVVFFGKNC